MKHGKRVPQIFEHKVKTASQLLFSKYYQPVPKRKRVHLHDYWSFLLRALLSYLPNPSSPAIVWEKRQMKSRIFCHLNAIVVNFKSNLSAWPFIISCHLLMVSTFNGYRRNEKRNYEDHYVSHEGMLFPIQMKFNGCYLLLHLTVQNNSPADHRRRN